MKYLILVSSELVIFYTGKQNLHKYLTLVYNNKQLDLKDFEKTDINPDGGFM